MTRSVNAARPERPFSGVGWKGLVMAFAGPLVFAVLVSQVEWRDLIGFPFLFLGALYAAYAGCLIEEFCAYRKARKASSARRCRSNVNSF